MASCLECSHVKDCLLLLEVDEALGGVSETMEHFQRLMDLSASLRSREEVLRVRRQELDRVVFSHFARQRILEKTG